MPLTQLENNTMTINTTPRRTHHRALLAKLPSPGQSAWHLDHSLPAAPLGDGQVLIETTYVALNPFDWQGVEFKYGIGEEAKVMGRDGAGVIVGVGKDVDRFKLGDRVWFCANSSSSHTGAFQEFSVHSASEIGHTPEHISDQEAATLGTGLITAGVALFRTLNLPLDELSRSSTSEQVQRKTETKADDRPWILIWGGAGITGVYLIELARLLGYRVICSASPANHEYVKSLGADVVLDRWSDPEQLVEEIRKQTNDGLRVAIDNVGGKTAALCYRALQGSSTWREAHNLPAKDTNSAPGRLVPIAGSPKELPVAADAVREVESLRISFSTTFYGHPEFSEALLDRFDELLADKQLTPARIWLVGGGLSGIEKGLEDLRHGRVPGGYKLVARLADTPEVQVQVQPEVQAAAEHVAVKRSREEENDKEGKRKRVEVEHKPSRPITKRHREAKDVRREVEVEAEPAKRAGPTAIAV